MTIIGRCYLDPITQEVFLTRPALSFSLASMECFLSLFSVPIPELETISTSLIQFNLIKIGGKGTFLLEEITIPLLLLDSRASASSRADPRPQSPQKPVNNPHFTVAGPGCLGCNVAGPGWCLEQVQVTTGAAFLPRRAPPHCTTAHNAHVHVPGWLTSQIFTPYFATSHSFFFNF